MTPLTKESLVGSWYLLSHETQQEDQSWKPWGNNARGLLLYTSQGTMSVSLNKDPEGDAKNLEIAFSAILFYAGKFDVVNDVVTHQVEFASDLSRVGKALDRQAKLEGDTLTLLAARSDGKLTRVRWGRAT